MKNLLKSAIIIAVAVFSTQLAQAQQKIGHINFGELISSTPEFKNAQEQYKVLQDAKTKELQDMGAAFQKKQTEANDKLLNRSEANKATVDAELQAMGEELRTIDTRIQEVQRLAQEELGKKEQELFDPIQKKVLDAINAVAKEKGYAYVFDISGSQIPYFQGGDDLTPDVKTKLGVVAK
ncbi:OmpH/Skp family outer membrane protein [Sphingobacterium hungaricum]|uniref:Periplasmic chaperone for outer membrane proteins Skp n=1 Tax=Sphingobacterium hungaricum TaxID=2082723 RepID=A0A928UYK6_9SPHI|nr:OmpH family outer membrane protein [Sphingobacterium hungaricum]MBE8715403.1 hypothetical protein [Sphingobacterium hungaricum]